MNSVSFDILRQSGWDLWVLVSSLASLVLISYALLGKLWRRAATWPAFLLCLVGVGGTTVVIALPWLHTPMVGLVWTFALMAILSATFYLKLLPTLGQGKTALLF